MSNAVLDPLITHGLAAAVRAGMFRDKDEAMPDALSTWLAAKPNLRLEVAAFFLGEGTVTLDRAAEIAGLNRWQFQDRLTQRGLKSEVEAGEVSELSAAARDRAF